MKKRTYIYKGFERFWHWTQALLIFFLALTGFEIHGAFELFGYQKAVLYHDVAAWSFIVLIVFTIFWHFATGEWRQYVPTVKMIKAQYKYYISGIFQGAEHPVKKTSYNKFNPIQRLTYFGLKIIIIPLMVISGIIYMYYMYPENPAHNVGLEVFAMAHTFGAFLLIVFLIAHLYLLTTNDNPAESLAAMIKGWEEVEVDPADEHREHMQYAVDKSIAGYYRLDEDGNFVDVNNAWLELYKCNDKNKIINQHFSLTRSEKHFNETKEIFERVLKGESVRGIPVVRKCFDGSSGKHILSMNPTFQGEKIVGVEGFVIDISDLADVQEQIYYSVRNSEAGYYRINKNGYYEDVNEAWLKLYKCESEENVIGKHFSLSRREEDLEQLTEIFQKVMKGETVPSEIAVRKCKDGTCGKHILSANPVYTGSEITGMEGFILDITSLENELAES